MSKKIQAHSDVKKGTIGGYIVVRSHDQEIREADPDKKTAQAFARALTLRDETPHIVVPAEPELVREWESWCWTTDDRLVDGKVVVLALIDR